MAQLLVHLITVTLCGQEQPPSPKAIRVTSPVNGRLSGVLHQQKVGLGTLGTKTASGQRSELPSELSLASAGTVWSGTGQPRSWGGGLPSPSL